MSWCDKLASTAGMGFKLNHHFAPAERMLQSLAPVLDPLVKNGQVDFALERLEGYNLVVTTNEGFRYGAEPSKVNVTFHHRLRAKQVSGGLPQMEMLSSPLPFTKLLPAVTEKLIEATLLLGGPKSRVVNRIGITSSTAVAEDEMPPGIRRFIDYIRRPWNGNAEFFHIQIVAQLERNETWNDRCIHTVGKGEENPDKLVNINLDWQRTYEKGISIKRDAIADLVERAEKPALQYFETVAEGSMFDEELIRSTS